MMQQTVSKKKILVVSDHTDLKNSIRNAVVELLKSRDIGYEIIERASEKDSYVKIAEQVCVRVGAGSKRPHSDHPDSAVVIDKYGTGSSSAINTAVGLIAHIASEPISSREITVKNNPHILCIPVYIGLPACKLEINGEMVKVRNQIIENPIDNIQKTVESWLDTEYLAGIPDEDRPRYKERQEENYALHQHNIKAFMRTVVARQTLIQPSNLTISSGGEDDTDDSCDLLAEVVYTEMLFKFSQLLGQLIEGDDDAAEQVTEIIERKIVDDSVDASKVMLKIKALSQQLDCVQS